MTVCVEGKALFYSQALSICKLQIAEHQSQATLYAQANYSTLL